MLYKKFEEVGGIVHTRSSWVTSFAKVGKVIPCFGTTHADYFYRNVPCTRKMTEEEIKGHYEEETGNVIVQTSEGINPIYVPGVLVNNELKSIDNTLLDKHFLRKHGTNSYYGQE